MKVRKMQGVESECGDQGGKSGISGFMGLVMNS